MGTTVANRVNGAQVDPLALRDVGDPVNLTDTLHLYQKLVSGEPELFYDNDDRAPVQMTSGGGLNAAVLVPNAFLRGGNTFGGDAIIGLLDAFDLTIQTDGTKRMEILETGEIIMGSTGLGVPIVAGDPLTIDRTFNGTARFVVMNRNTGTAGLVQIQARSLLSGGNAVSALMEQISLTNTINSGIRQTGKMILATSGGNHNGLNIGTENASVLAFYTNALERARFASNGPVLLFQTTVALAPSNDHIEGNKSLNGAYNGMRARNTNAGTLAIAEFLAANDTDKRMQVGITSGGYTGGVGGGVADTAFLFSTGAGGIVIEASLAAPIKFETTSLERMRIFSGGQVHIGTSVLASTVFLKVESNVNAARAMQMINLTDGTIARASIQTGTVSISLSMHSTAATFNALNGLEPSHNHLTSAVGNLIIHTTSNASIKFKTGAADLLRWTILHGGADIQGFNGFTLQGGAGVDTLTLSGGAGVASLISIGIASELIGLYGVAPVVRGAALTGEDGTAIDATYGSDEEGVLNNVRTRIGELEARMQGIGAIN